MKKLIVFLLSTSFALLSSGSFADKGGRNGTIDIIHKPDDQAIIITISQSALEAHIAHGDCIYSDGDSDSGVPPERSGYEPGAGDYCDGGDDEEPPPA